MTPWEIKAKEFSNCNCSYGCPCQFNALPTTGYCEAVVAMEIQQGHYGHVKLDGLRMGGIYQWPGAVHEGHGKYQPFIDVRADENQREALLKIMSGRDTDPMATMFAVYFSTVDKVYDPIFAPVEFEVDVEGRKGRYVVQGLVETRGEPIKNPVTGAEHRARIDLPHGFEYEIAEIGSGTTKTQGNIQLDLKSSYGQFAHLHLNNHGVVRHRTT
ncbi:MAG TPA: DUF1326 domain-containing protein [Burkholderiaceae bacterium]|jgi:hypothetical protein|nr:DUF1326 domain-containing protein [Burkholderiaceae bacterium]